MPKHTEIEKSGLSVLVEAAQREQRRISNQQHSRNSRRRKRELRSELELKISNLGNEMDAHVKKWVDALNAAIRLAPEHFKQFGEEKVDSFVQKLEEQKQKIIETKQCPQ